MIHADHPVIHRDIKSSNILLTSNCRAKVADFGFAKLAPTDASYVSTQVKGTAGYLDPEYLRTYQLNEKSDVYSFGVLLVELVTGRRPIEPKKPIIERVTAKWVSFCHSKYISASLMPIGFHYLAKLLKHGSVETTCIHLKKAKRKEKINTCKFALNVLPQ